MLSGVLDKIKALVPKKGLSGEELEEIIERAAREEWEELDLAGNELKVLPPTIGKLKNLKRLILGKWDDSKSKFIGNDLTSLPKEIFKLTNLEILSLGSNQIKEIPAAIAQLTNLQSLYLDHNQIKEIPVVIVQLTNLQSLYLDHNQIKEIPVAIAQLTNLEILSLGSNQIKEIPAAIAQLTNLQILYLYSNQIKEIPAAIAQLTNLQILSLGSNQIKEIPAAIAQLTNLKSLYLDNNQIKEIPAAIAQLTNLQILYLYSNQIKEIPAAIAQLTNLQTLSVFSNQIKEIPAAIAQLTNLQTLNLRFNPIANPPLEVVEKGIEAIREYFKQLEAEGTDYLYEAKLLIVGEGGAGKTTLANKIINPAYQLRDEESTKGIQVKRWTFPLPNGKTFAVNIWDFGGQEIYHATHQYFLTKRSLYALVADSRKEDTDFYYWLNIVDLLSDNSPILIVKNEKQDRQREININQLRGEFGNLQADLATNFADNRGLNQLLDTFQFYLNQLPHIGSALPKTWVKVRQALETDRRNYISLEAYLQICQTNGFKEPKDALQLSDYLHDLGVCLHFQDEPLLKKTIILKPKWGTDAAYAVLDNPQVIHSYGRFSRSDLAQIWQADTYNGMHDELLQLMMKFQLCYEIPQSKGNFIAPQLLTENQPRYDWDESNNLILRYSYDFMPKGLVRQFIVAMHTQIESQDYVWRSGVIIKNRNINNTRAEVTETYGKPEIKIRISGTNKKELLAIIINEFDQIHDLYSRLQDKYQKLIPCNCFKCKGSQSPNSYEFSDLKRRYENRKDTVECKISYEDVDVLSLIDDIGARSQLQAPKSNPDRELLAEYNQDRLTLNLSVHTEVTQNNKMENQQNNLPEPQPSPQLPPIKSSWANGSFYLVVFVVVVGGIGYLAGNLGIEKLVAVIVAGILFIPLIGVLQLRQDDRLSEQGFIELIKLVIAQLPLIGNFFKPKNPEK
jgi:internalin A